MSKFNDLEDGDTGFPPEATAQKLVKKSNGEYQPTYPAVWVSDAKLELNSRYLVKGLIDQASFTLIYGPAGSGKSFFTADIAQSVATGRAWRGHRVNKSLVVYVASEAGSSILKRFIGWREKRLVDAQERVPLVVLTRGPSLLEEVATSLLEHD